MAPEFGKGFHAATGPTGTAVPKVAPGENQAPANRISALTSINLAEANLKACREILKDPFLLSTITWHLQ